jgi:hypothetical protein
LKLKSSGKSSALRGKVITVPLYFWLSLIAIFAAPAIQDEIPPHDELPRNESRFTFARFSYPVNIAWLARPLGDYGPPWSHDWPDSEEHFMKILSEVSKLDVNPGGHIISFESDECFKYPIAYFCEMGYLNLTDREVQNMREYLLRGGFLIVDDFRQERALQNFRYQMRRDFPDRVLEEVPRTDPIWTCFYDISKLNIEPPYQRWFIPQYFGISDDKGRLMMVVNYNNDISEYWEWSDNPVYPIRISRLMASTAKISIWVASVTQ